MVTQEILFGGEKGEKITQAAQNTWSESRSITRKRIYRHPKLRARQGLAERAQRSAAATLFHNYACVVLPHSS